METKKAVVLLSGGQDSTTCLYWAIKEFEEVHALSFHYGQRHATELIAAGEIAAHAGVPHKAIPIDFLQAITSSALFASAAEGPKGDGGLVDKEMPQGLPTSFVPGRNIFLFTMAAVYATSIGAKAVVSGVCQTDYSGYPDCREEFVRALEVAVNLGLPSSTPVNFITPLMHLSKAETVRMAKGLGGCWEALRLSTTCYYGKRPGCGECAACVLRAKGFEEARQQDPAAFL